MHEIQVHFEPIFRISLSLFHQSLLNEAVSLLLHITIHADIDYYYPFDSHLIAFCDL